MLKWLHAEDVDFATGLAKNEVLETLFFDESNAARRDWQRKQVPAGTKWEGGEFRGNPPASVESGGTTRSASHPGEVAPV